MLVAYNKYALRHIKNGRRADIENEYINIVVSKEQVGALPKTYRKYIEEGKSKDEAYRLSRLDKVQDEIKIIHNRKNKRLIRTSNKQLAWKYAEEKVNSLRKDRFPQESKAIWTGLMRKWEAVGTSWCVSGFGEPSFKKYPNISAIQKQKALQELTEFIDLSWCGSPLLQQVKVIIHRPLPLNSEIVQVALKKKNTRWFVVIMVKAPAESFQKNYTSCNGKVIGIDPGVKNAITTSDGKKYKPKSLSHQKKMQQKLHRLERKLDKQTRIHNPFCYDDKGRFIRGKRIKIRTKSMLKTATDIREIHRYFDDAKKDFWNNSAKELLNSGDVIGVGNAKMHTLVREEGRANRNWNRSVRANSVSQFINILKDKASLSLTPKQVFDINEAYTSKMCCKCGHINHDLTMDMREWTCKACNTHHDRDIQAAENIKNKTISLLTNEAKPAAAQTVGGL